MLITLARVTGTIINEQISWLYYSCNLSIFEDVKMQMYKKRKLISRTKSIHCPLEWHV